MSDKFDDIFGDYDFTGSTNSVDDNISKKMDYQLTDSETGITDNLEETKKNTLIPATFSTQYLKESTIGTSEDLEKDIFEDPTVSELITRTKEHNLNDNSISSTPSKASWSNLAETEQDDFLAWLDKDEKTVDAIFPSSITAIPSEESSKISETNSKTSEANSKTSETNNNISETNKISDTSVEFSIEDEQLVDEINISAPVSTSQNGSTKSVIDEIPLDNKTTESESINKDISTDLRIHQVSEVINDDLPVETDLTVLTHEAASSEISNLLKVKNAIDVEAIRGICKRLGYIPQELRKEVWPRLLHVEGRRDSLHANSLVENQSIENQEILRKDAQEIAQRLANLDSIVFPDEALLIDQIENLLTLYCKRRSINYTIGLGNIFAPLFVVFEQIPNPMVFNCMYSISKEILPYISTSISHHSVASARRPLLKLLMLYHDPSLSRYLEHHYAEWVDFPIVSIEDKNNDKNNCNEKKHHLDGAIPDSWLASMFEGKRQKFDELLPLWDRIFMRFPILPIYNSFILLGLLISQKEEITRRTDEQLEKWFKQFTTTCFEDISFVCSCCDIADNLDNLTPISFKQTMIRAGLQLQEETETKETQDFFQEQEQDIDDEEDILKDDENSLTAMTKKFSESINEIQTKLLDQLSPTSKQNLSPQFNEFPISFEHPEFFCITVGAGEVVPSVIQGRKKPSENQMKYFIVDCRASEYLSQGHLPTAFHLDPESLTKPELIDRVVSTLGPFRSNVHLCVMGQGTGCSSLISENKDGFLDFMAKDSSQVNDAVLFLTKHRFPFVSVLEGGYTAVHSFLANAASFDLSDLADHSSSCCYICGGSPEKTVNTQKSDSVLHPSSKYFSTLSGALKDGKGWLSRRSSSLEKTTGDGKTGDKIVKSLSSRDKDNIPVDKVLDIKKKSQESDEKVVTSSSSTDGKTQLLPTFLSSRFSSQASRTSDINSKGESNEGKASMVAAAISRGVNLTNSSRAISQRLKTTFSSLKSVATATNKGKVEEEETGDRSSIFTIDDDLDQEEVSGTSSSCTEVSRICQGMVSGLKKGDSIKSDELAALANGSIFPCYKKKKIEGNKYAMLPRYIAIVEKCIIVFQSCDSTKGIFQVKSNHHVSELARMTFQKKNLQIINLYFRDKQVGEEFTNADAFQIEQRDDFIAALRSCMQESTL